MGHPPSVFLTQGFVICRHLASAAWHSESRMCIYGRRTQALLCLDLVKVNMVRLWLTILCVDVDIKNFLVQSGLWWHGGQKLWAAVAYCHASSIHNNSFWGWYSFAWTGTKLQAFGNCSIVISDVRIRH